MTAAKGGFNNGSTIMNLATLKSLSISQTALTKIDLSGLMHHIGATQEGDAANNAFVETAGNDVMYGNGGDDRFNLGGGSDKAFGGSGDDYFNLWNGNLLASGGAGSDTIVGRGTGDYTMTGGAGADRFALSDSFHGNATITDFNGAAGDRLAINKPLESWAYDPAHATITYGLSDGSTVIVHGADQNIERYVDFF